MAAKKATKAATKGPKFGSPAWRAKYPSAGKLTKKMKAKKGKKGGKKK